MTKNKKILIVSGAGLVSIILVIVCIFAFLSPQRTTIYTFKNAYSAGTQITSDMFTPIQVDSTIVVAGAKADMNKRFVTNKEFEEIIKRGDSLKMDVGEGTPLMLSFLSVTGGNAIEMSMKSSAIAVTVNVDNISGVTDELGAESRVHVYVSYRASRTTLLLENMRVLEVYKNNDGSLNSATLEVNNDQALKLIEAQNNGSLHLGLVNGSGYQYINPNAQ